MGSTEGLAVRLLYFQCLMVLGICQYSRRDDLSIGGKRFDTTL